jgi:hypothetical protein
VVFLFRDKSIINVFFLVILSIGIHLHFFVSAPVVVFNDNDGVFSLFLKIIFQDYPYRAFYDLPAGHPDTGHPAEPGIE